MLQVLLFVLPAQVEQSFPSLVGIIREGFASKNWGLVVGAALMILVMLTRPLLERWKKIEGVAPFLPWIVVVVAVLASVGSALITGSDLFVAMLEAAEKAGLAALVYSTVGKKVENLFRPEKRSERATLAEAEKEVRRGSLRLSEKGGVLLGDVKVPD